MITKRVYEIVGVEPGKALPAFSSIGCYPIFYLTERGDILCAACANEDDNGDDDPVTCAGVHWEGEPMQCDDCECEIESAYGPVSEGE